MSRNLRLVALLLSFGLLAAAALPRAAATGPTVRPFASWLPYGTMVLDARGVPHFAWVDSGNVITATVDRVTGTLTHLQPVVGLASSFYPTGQLEMVSAGPRIFVLWSQTSPTGDIPRGLVAFSEDGGATFAGPIVLPADQPYSFQAAGDAAGNLYVAWYDGKGGTGAYPFSIHFAILPMGQTTFGPTAILATEHVGFPTIAVDGNRVYVAWAWTYNPASLVYVRTSQDHGATFDAPVIVAPEDNVTKYSATVVAGSGFAYVIWQYVVSLEFGYALSSDGGLTFTAGHSWPSGLGDFAYGPDGAFYGIAAVPTAYTRVAPGEVNGTRIETGAPSFPHTYYDEITAPNFAVDAAGHFFFLFTLVHVLVMTGSDYEAQESTYLITDLALTGTPFPVFEVALALATGAASTLVLSVSARRVCKRSGARVQSASAPTATASRRLGWILGPLRAQGSPRKRPVLALVLSTAGGGLELFLGLLFFVAIGGANASFGLTGYWMALWVFLAPALVLAAPFVTAVVPRWHDWWGGAALTASMLSLIPLPLAFGWAASLGIIGGALVVLRVGSWSSR